MKINQAKDKIQRKVLNTWWKAKCIGTVEAATAFGKCRIGVLASAYFAKQYEYNCKILIIVPTTAIQEEWRKEFIKWKESKTYKQCIQIECINTARKFKNESYQLVICDEIHNYLLGTVNNKFFKNNNYSRILGLSGTIEDNLIESLNKIAPICYTLNLYEAQELGLVSNFTIYNIGVSLNTKETNEYIRLSKIIDYSWKNYSVHSWKNISERKNILYNAKAKMKLLKELTNSFGTNSNGIVFSMTKDYSNKITDVLGDRCLSHHSGITKKNRILTLKKFTDGRTKVNIISSAKTLDEGVTLPKLTYSIIMSSSSKSKQMRQRIGRCIRLGENGKHAIIIRLYCKNTVEEKWLDSSQKDLKIINVKNIKELKKLIK